MRHHSLRGDIGIACLLRPVTDEDADKEQNAHRREDGPTLLGVARHLAERIGERGGDQKDRENLQEVRQRRRIFEWVRAVRVEKSAAVRSEHFDRLLRSDRTLRDQLRRAFQSFRLSIRSEVLRNSLPDQNEGEQKRDRQENVQSSSRDVRPEVSNSRSLLRAVRVFRRAARQSSNHCDRYCQTCRRRHPVVNSERDHVREVRHRRFRNIRLPVGVCRKADRRVESQVGGHLF